MNEIELAYRKYLDQSDKKSLDDYAQQASKGQYPPIDATTVPSATKPASKPSESVLYKGAKSTAETAVSGYHHFVNGLYSAAGGGFDPTKEYSTTDDLSHFGSGMGEALLGGLTILGAIPTGGGDAVQQFMKNWTPGIESSAVVPGMLAGVIRQTMAAPMLLDPKFRAIFDNAQSAEAFWKELYKPMTAGELTNTIIQFYLFGKQGKVMKNATNFGAPFEEGLKKGFTDFARDMDRPYGGPLDVAAAAGVKPQLALPRGESQKAFPMPEDGGVQGIWPTGPGVKSQPPMTPVDLATRLQVLAEELRGIEKSKRGNEAAYPKAEPEYPSAGEGQSKKPGTTTEKGTMEGVQTFEDAKTGAKATVVKAAAGDADALLPTDHYIIDTINTPEANRKQGGASGLIKQIVEQADKEGLPVAALANEQSKGILAKEGFKAVDPTEPNFLSREPVKAEAAKPAEAPQAPSYVQEFAQDVTKGTDIAEQTLSKIMEEADTGLAKIFGRPKGKKPTGGVTGEGGFAAPDLMKVLARMALGAAIGGTQGSTPEERIQYALAGALGGAVAGKVASAIVKALRAGAPRVLDDVNSTIPGYRVDPPTRIKQPSSGGMNVGRIASLEPGEMLSPAEMQQARHVEVQSVQQVFDIAKAIKEGERVAPGDLREAIAQARTVSAALRGVRSSYGQTGAGRGIESRVQAAQRAIGRDARLWDPVTPEPVLADIVTAFPRAEQVSLFSRLYYAVPEAISQAMYGAMLSGKSIIKNGVGNAPMLPIAAIDRSLASLKFWDPSRPNFKEGPMAFVAMWEGITDQLRIIKEPGRWQALAAQAQEMGTSHVEVAPRGFEALGEMAGESGWTNMAKGLQWIGNAADLGPGVMQRTDGMFKAINGRMAVQWEAMQKAGTEGRHNSGYWDRVNEIVQDYSQLDADQLVRIKHFRDHQTFTQPFEGRLLNALQMGPDDPVLNLMYRMTIGTFVRTPLRLLEIGAEYTPGLNFVAKNFYNEMKAGGSSASVAQARLATGSILIGSFMYMAMQGAVTGDPPNDPKERKALEDAGQPPRSWWDPVAGKYRSYAGMEPLSTLIATGANLAKVIHQLPEEDAINLILGASLAEFHGTGSNGFIQSVGEVLDIFKGNHDDTYIDNGLKYIRRRLDQFYPAAVRELGALEDPEKHRILPDVRFNESHDLLTALHREFRMLYDDYTRDLPGFDRNRKADRNIITGTPIVSGTWPFNPFTTVPEQPDPWAAEVRRMEGAGLKRVPAWIGGAHDQPDMGLSQQAAGPGIPLSAKELDRLEVIMTQEVRDGHGLLADSLNNLVQSVVYGRQPDITKKQMIQERFHGFQKMAEATLIRENQPLRRALENKQGAFVNDRLPLDDPRRKPRTNIGITP